MENKDENNGFHVNYDRIVKEKSLLSITRLLASDLSKNPYMTVGDFFKNASNGDIEALVKIIDDGEKHENFGDLMLLSMMLSAAEGCEGTNIDEYTEDVNLFTSFVVCESLARKGLVKIHRENMSFGEDLKNMIIIERLDD